VLLLPAVLLVLGLVLCPLRIYGPGMKYVPGDLGDARFNNYILEHDYRFFTGQTESYWDAPLMYPFKNTIAFSDNLLGSAPIYALFRTMGSDREMAFQLWLLSLFAINFMCCYWALNKWSSNVVMASVGAYIFAFSILLASNIYNVQTYPRFVVPLVFYWTWRYFDSKQLKYFAFLIFGIVFQFYCGIYLGFLLVFTLMFFTIGYFVVYRDFQVFTLLKSSRRLILHVVVVILAAGSFYPLMKPYIDISNIISPPPYEAIFPTIPTWRSYFFTSKAPVFWNSLSDHGTVLQWFWCHYLFIGALPWIGLGFLPVVLFSKRTSREVKRKLLFITLGLLLCFVSCLNIDGFSLYKYFYELPGFASMRSMNRIINIEVFLFIMVLFFVFNELKNYNVVFRIVVWILPVVVILDNLIDPEQVMRYDKDVSLQRVENVRSEIEAVWDDKHVAVAYSVDSIENVDRVALHLDVMLATQEMGVPSVNAYSGHSPGEFVQFFESTSDTALQKWCVSNSIDTSIILKVRHR
jgi:hypothetical protein